MVRIKRLLLDFNYWFDQYSWSIGPRLEFYGVIYASLTFGPFGMSVAGWLEEKDGN